jgi:hypothetical protein
MAQFTRLEGTAVLERTPHALRCLLDGMPDAWLDCDEGPDTFSPREVIAHLIHGERTDWLERVRRILADGEETAFEPFDRFAHRSFCERPVHELLDEFDTLRRGNLDELKRVVRDDQLDLRGLHPALGVVTMRQLLAAWVVHDLTHIAQIARVMARRYAADVGPWREYLGVLNWRA